MSTHDLTTPAETTQLKNTTYEIPACPEAEIFPVVDGDALQALADDIRTHGLREPIVLLGDNVLDGRSRLEACRLAGVEPRFESWDGQGTPLDFVVSRNLRRRHLDESQRAEVAARLKEHYALQAKERQRAAGGAAPGPLSADLREAKGKASEKAAQVMNVSPRLVEDASKVLNEGSPQLIEDLQKGRVSASAAARSLRRSAPRKRSTKSTTERPCSDDEYRIRRLLDLRRDVRAYRSSFVENLARLGMKREDWAGHDRYGGIPDESEILASLKGVHDAVKPADDALRAADEMLTRALQPVETRLRDAIKKNGLKGHAYAKAAKATGLHLEVIEQIAGHRPLEAFSDEPTNTKEE
jgi:hypothetical protein